MDIPRTLNSGVAGAVRSWLSYWTENRFAVSLLSTRLGAWFSFSTKENIVQLIIDCRKFSNLFDDNDIIFKIEKLFRNLCYKLLNWGVPTKFSYPI